jgi:ribosomal protein S18 acetylase RimI-like enzyme
MVLIKPARVSDAALIAELGRKIFFDTFAKENTTEDMTLYLSQAFGISQQTKELEDPNRRTAIAWVGEEAAGFYHLLIGTPDPAVTGPKPIEVSRLYVDAKWHGRGIGAVLMEGCLEAGRCEGFETIWLGVWEKNFRAQAFYRKYSFEVVGQHVFTVGRDNQNDLLMSRAL